MVQEALQITFADFPVHRVDRRRPHPDQQIVGFEPGLGRVFVMQLFGAAVGVNAHGLHGRHKNPPQARVG